ncbi:MAG: hypothetical protein KAT34_14690 [Candidatus Aminicenantes bacterium]|nr:hypothetical protein [Candidatus Aminicenantes bacterium]
MSENEQKDNESLLLEDYITKKRFSSKFWVKVTVFLFILLFAYIFKTSVFEDKMNPEVLQSSIEIFDISSHWVVKEEVDEPDFKGIVLVPEISFRIRNIGKIDFQYVLMIGVFRLQNSAKPIGEGYRMLFHDPLAPGSESDRIVITSPFGYRATSKQAFDKNSRNWRSSLVEIYVKLPGFGMLPIKNFYIDRKIEGLNIEIKVV